MGEQATISVITPSHNMGSHLGNAIRSVLEQDYPAVDYQVIDAHSTDGSRAVLESFGPRLRWISEPDAGQSDALNKGFSRGTGGILGWLNADDVYAHGRVFSTVAGLFQNDPALDFVYADGEMIDSAGHMFRRYPGRTLRSPKDVLLHPASFAMQPTVFFRRELFERLGPLRTDLHWAMDYELWLRLVPGARKILHVPEVWARAMYHVGAKSIRGLRRQIAEVRAIKLAYRERFNLTPLDHLALHAGIASLYAYWLAVRTGLRRAS